MDTKSLLKIDFLREAAASYGSSPYCFGLGFIQLKLSDQARMHFWHMAVPHVEREEILLVIWLLLDRNNIYFDQFLKKAWGYVCDLWQLAMLFKE